MNLTYLLAMALVAYDYDSGSEKEEEVEETSAASVVLPENNSIGKLLSDLPKTKASSNDLVEDKLEDFIPKYKPAESKPPPKVKITIPSLSEFSDVDTDEPAPKKVKATPKGSGLLSVLPPVRGTPLTVKSFVPNTVKKLPVDKKKQDLIPYAIRKKAELAKKAAILKITKGSGSDLESDDDLELPESFDEEMWKKVCGRPEPKKVPQLQKIPEIPVPVPTINIAPEPEKPYEGLDNQAFKELVGKNKRPLNIKLIDINEEEVLSDKDMWMTKSLTDPNYIPDPEIDEVDDTKRKKHHITYLAQQAKLNEEKFKKEWASSKHTRNQTRAKYGF